jgi:predicted flap endonuclease-1-like 5' DNA nuclease
MWSNFLSCYLWWLLAGFLIGWLCHWLLCKCCGACQKNAAAPLPESALAPTAEQAIDVAAAKLAGITVKGADDLEVIEGIGPKICGLFHAAGFITFAQVSRLSVAQMSKILDDAGPRFRLANPETWAQQAHLAATNQWAALKTLQDDLTAGVTVQQDRHEL